MNAAWWGKESIGGAKMAPGPLGPQPQLAAAARGDVVAEVRSRIAAFTPKWTNFAPGDPGIALIEVFAEQMSPVLRRLNRLAEKAAVEFFTTANVTPLAATPAKAIVRFEVSPTAPSSVLVPQGFQLSAPPVDGQGDAVIFETASNLYAAPLALAEVYVQQGSSFEQITMDAAATFRPFGRRSAAGNALWLGFTGGNEATIGPNLSLGIAAAAPSAGRVPSPVGAGGVAPPLLAPTPMMQWEVLDGGRIERLEVLRDETEHLSHGGIVELKLPGRWRQGLPSGVSADKPPMRWLRLRIVYGKFQLEPVLSAVHVNVVAAVAARTIFNEVLTPVPDSGGRRMRLSQRPVIPNSLVLEIDDGNLREDDGGGAATAEEGDESSNLRRFREWKPVATLLDQPGDAQVYVLHAPAGEVTFGDGVHGAALPEGFRHVRAAKYQTGGGSSGAVAAEAIATMLSSATFVTAVSNPQPASGGSARETSPDAMRRGAQEIRARGRAVTVADYALYARRAPGAQVVRAHAVSGRHPASPGRPVPGVVGVYVVPPDRSGVDPPLPDEQTLRAVAIHLSEQAAPAGVQVVSAAPKYHFIRADVVLELDPAADAGAIITKVLSALDTYLHPLRGGDDGQGWPFGGTVAHASVVRLISNVKGVRAVVALNLIADGVRLAGCADFTPTPHSLLWPRGHQVSVRAPRGTP